MDLDVFDLDDLDLDDITVTSMRDAVALPETGMSSQGDGAACSCCGSSSCCPNIDTYQPF